MKLSECDFLRQQRSFLANLAQTIDIVNEESEFIRKSDISEIINDQLDTLQAIKVQEERDTCPYLNESQKTQD